MMLFCLTLHDMQASVYRGYPQKKGYTQPVATAPAKPAPNSTTTTSSKKNSSGKPSKSASASASQQHTSAAHQQLIQNFLHAVQAIPESATTSYKNKAEYKKYEAHIKKAEHAYKELYPIQHELMLSKAESQIVKKAVVKLFKSTNIKNAPWHPLAKSHAGATSK